jgi:hypothetical protein
MATDRPSPKAKSSNPKTGGNFPPNKPTTRPHVARAQRDDTPEAKDQRARVPKTHPTASPSAARKDSKTKHPRG